MPAPDDLSYLAGPTNQAKKTPFLLFIALILCILAIRQMSGLLLAPGGEPYLHARLARTFQARGLIASDHLLAGGIPLPFNPYDAIIFLLAYPLGDIQAAIITPILLGLATLFAVARLNRHLHRPPYEQTIILTLLALSPTFIHDSLITGERMAALAFMAMSAALLLEKSMCARIGGLCAAIMASTFSPLIALTTIAANTILLLYTRLQWRWIAAIAMASILGASLNPLGSHLIPYQDPGITHELADLGALDGIPTFTILLAAIGIVLIWPRKLAILSIISLAIASSIDHHLITTTNTILSILAGMTIHALLKRKWVHKDLKRLSILVIACGLIFSTISVSMQLARAGPTDQEAASLTWLRGHSRSGQAVLSSPQNGHWIQYFAIRPAILDERIEPQGNLSTSAAETFRTFNIDTAEEFLAKTNTSYIYITPDMVNGSVWNEPNQGLHYLISGSETFNNIYRRDGIEIYEYLKGPRPKIQP